MIEENAVLPDEGKAENRLLLKQASVGFVTKALGSGLTFLASILFARHLGVESFGRYSLAISVANIMSTLAVLGLPMLIVRWVAVFYSEKKWGELKAMVYAGLKWPFLAIILISLFMLGSGRYWLPSDVDQLLWMQRAGLEWFFRLMQEPRRLWRRYLYHNIRFILLTGTQLLANKR